MTPADLTNFENWRSDFITRAEEEGVSPRTIRLFLEHSWLLPDVLERQENQKEILWSVRDYLDITVSDERVRKGRKALRANRPLMAALEEKYQVSADVILAIWGLETGYGAVRGSYEVLSALATLASRGKRTAFFESELIAALKIVQKGHIAPQNMVGSWAGAMGHGQFMPSSYLAYAVDFDGDKRRDIWGTDPTDALASIANYLHKFGWRYGQPCSEEAFLPAGFDLSLTGRDQPRDVMEWGALGVRLSKGLTPSDYGMASLILPAGANGPAVLAYQNFDVILKYNNALSYALSVGCLAHRIGGNQKFSQPWPEDQRILTRAEMQDLQQRLTHAGFDTLGADGLAGPNTHRALRAFQQAEGLPADGFPCGAMLDRLMAVA
ncbi:lytic murein transglycosylase [Aliiroseovarius lamellibrachiae]|uniref:lytic murein transglycosylase n=1 Tax=Aliiroseovarius lamellibrachiae TaxID=1924933 RepID=UPI0031B87070